MTTDPGQPGVGGDGHPPPLVVGEVQVECVELVQRHQVHVPAQVGHRLEVPGDVEHRPPPRVRGHVADLDAGQHPRGVPLRRARQGLGGQQLTDRLDTAEQARQPRGAQQNGVRADGESVALLAEAAELRVECQHDAAGGGGRERQTGGRGEQGAQQVGGALRAGIGPHRGVLVEGEPAGAGRDLARAGDEGLFGA